MTHVSIIGAGNMGRAIAELVTKAGSTAETFTSKDHHKPITGDVVVLAVPYPAVADVLAHRKDQLAGKVVIDITNPLNFETFDELTVPADSSAAAEIAARLPESRVLKAFNTNFAATLTTGTLAGQPTTVLVAGDDVDAKKALSSIVTGAGLRILDAGSLKRARELEALGFQQITLAAGEQISWTGGFAIAS